MACRTRGREGCIFSCCRWLSGWGEGGVDGAANGGLIAVRCSLVRRFKLVSVFSVCREGHAIPLHPIQPPHVSVSGCEVSAQQLSSPLKDRNAFGLSGDCGAEGVKLCAYRTIQISRFIPAGTFFSIHKSNTFKYAARRCSAVAPKIK